ncbi:hypothetical protein J437_LFUL007042 [Ladona fulva]|uniref:Uncharacterized protein n=1 Tax=Ladona fulva TaxID=123851 RepID=A0A8K0K170_LADFU|nr:hypothetical protein J437_LFUL007042 [Ladona fulva]
MKPSRLIDHSRKAHPDKTEKTITFFQSLRDRVQTRSTLSSMLCNASKHITDGLRASYNISLLIAKSGKPHTMNEYQRNIGRRELYQFPSLLKLEEQAGISDDDLRVFCDHLATLHKNMTQRFEDLLLLEIPDWVINPFVDIEEVGVLEKEFIGLQNDVELKPKFKINYQEFWLQKEVSDHYPALWMQEWETSELV